MMSDDDGQMIFGDPGGLKLPDICLTGEKKPKKPHPGNLSRPGISCNGPQVFVVILLEPGVSKETEVFRIVSF